MARAKREGLRSRAAYKLIEIDDKYRFLKPGARVVDLGAAPGGWSQVAAKRVGADSGRGRVVAIDILEMKPVAGVEVCISTFSMPMRRSASKALLGGPADVVLSDMAANATGHRKTDHLKIMALAETAGACSPARCSAPAAPSCARCCRAAPRARCSPSSSAISRPCEHVKPAASRAGFGGALRAGDGVPGTVISALVSLRRPL